MSASRKTNPCRYHSAWWLLAPLLLACCKCGLESAPGHHGSARATACGTDGCTTVETRVELQPLPPALQAVVKDNGPNLPLSLSRDAYDAIMRASYVRVRGTLAGTAGAAGLRASLRGSRELELALQLPPVPNLMLASETLGLQPRLTVSEVTDDQGRPLLDETSALNDDFFAAFRLDDEAPMFSGTGADSKVEVAGYELPGRNPVLYAKRTVPLAQSVEHNRIRRVSGELTLYLPLDAAVVTLNDDRWNVETDRYSLSVGRSEHDQVVRLMVDESPRLYVAHEAISRTGERLANDDCSLTLNEDEASLVVRCEYDASVRELRVAMAGEIVELRSEFALSP